MPGADDKTGDGEAFLARWARRKEAQRQTPPAEPEPADSGGSGEVEAAGEAEPPLRVEDLPDIETLDKSSDFTVFLKEGVPQSLRRRALRKLFRLDPVFANLDGLAEYDEDYHTVIDLPGGVKTLFQAGKGMVQPEAEESQEPAEQEPAEKVTASTETAEPQAEEPAAEAESDAPASLPEDSAEPLPDLQAQQETAVPAVDTAPAPAEPAAARGSAIKRRWGGFES